MCRWERCGPVVLRIIVGTVSFIVNIDEGHIWYHDVVQNLSRAAKRYGVDCSFRENDECKLEYGTGSIVHVPTVS